MAALAASPPAYPQEHRVSAPGPSPIFVRHASGATLEPDQAPCRYLDLRCARRLLFENWSCGPSGSAPLSLVRPWNRLVNDTDVI